MPEAKTLDHMILYKNMLVGVFFIWVSMYCDTNQRQKNIAKMPKCEGMVDINKISIYIWYTQLCAYTYALIF